MISFLTLLQSNLKLQLRNRSSLFWHFAFPVIFMVLFGLIFGGGAGDMKIGLSAGDGQVGKALKSAFSEIDDMKLTEGGKAKLIDKLKKGDLDVVIVVGKDKPQEATDVGIFYDESDTLGSSVGRSIARSVMDGINMKAYKVPAMFDVKEESVATESLSYISFLLPGVIGMSVMFSTMFGTAYPLVMEREKGILRGLKLTLVRPTTFIGSRAVVMVIIAFMQAAIILMTGVFFFGVQVVGSLLSAALIVFVGCLMMVSIGLFIAGLANRLESVDAIANSIGMPMMFLAGSFFPIDGAPQWLQSFGKVLPLTYLNDSLRDILIKGQALSDVRMSILIMCGWTLGFLALAIYFFKWEVPVNRKGT
ncbi:MAG: ABC transporter permease [Candidatus Aquicultorales bacterium]